MPAKRLGPIDFGRARIDRRPNIGGSYTRRLVESCSNGYSLHPWNCGSSDKARAESSRTNPLVKTETDLHGHAESVLRSHRWRTVENSCGYMLDI
jgi:hypothetical protein